MKYFRPDVKASTDETRKVIFPSLSSRSHTMSSTLSSLKLRAPIVMHELTIYTAVLTFPDFSAASNTCSFAAIIRSPDIKNSLVKITKVGNTYQLG